MTRYKLTIEYDGGPYVGWQVQRDQPTVQGALEDAVFALTGQRVEVYGAGRTDAGVHALAQVAHVDIEKVIPRRNGVRDALNAHLFPHAIAILDAQPVPDDWHARFSATGRRYMYRISDRRPHLALQRGRCWRVPQALDVAAMNHAAQRLIGTHDFTTFRHAACQAKSPVKTVDQLTVWRDGDQVVVEAAARSFLHNQVRSMVGTLSEVGKGHWSADDVSAALAARDRTVCGVVAPPDGLYLAAVTYDNDL